eukprot:gnl/MRDRNA2_/MRDRNA2_77059_c0_seq2.p1 gnl/MRDRNA2_/MRDRNA2_77059_c0~~gnl/MRDRNA2_/MRDRNA2_77059_c0_seq2.p1  ORF type:complete len:431 (-),score=80.03 gnl/MRDRNA2_/MRDRNA2_77059_c0_seq2:114-1262(-)
MLSGLFETQLMQLVQTCSGGNIDELIAKYYESKDRVDTLADFTNKQYRVLSKVADAIKAEKSKSRAYAELLVQVFGFNIEKSEAYCIKQHKGQNGESAAKVLQRTLMETKGVIDKRYVTSAEECKVKEGKMCPEGMNAVYLAQGFDLKQGMQVWSKAAATLMPTKFIAAGIGTLIAGPQVGLAIAGPPLEWLVPIPLALFYGADVMPKCRCYPKTCEWDEKAASCRLKNVGKGMLYAKISPSKNKYDWLPYPGSKCVGHKERTSRSAKEATTVCHLNACESTDLTPDTKPNQVTGVRGSIGWKDGGVYNCLSQETELGRFPLTFSPSEDLVRLLNEGKDASDKAMQQAMKAASEVDGYSTELRTVLYDRIRGDEAWFPVDMS